MKTKEFIASVENMGFKVEKDTSLICIKNIISRHDGTVAIVDEEYKNSMSTAYKRFVELFEDEQEDLFNLLVKYSKTPIESRKEYYIKFTHLEEGYNYLIYIARTNKWLANNKTIYQNEKMKFSLDELPSWALDMLDREHLYKEKVEDE